MKFPLLTTLTFLGISSSAVSSSTVPVDGNLALFNAISNKSGSDYNTGAALAAVGDTVEIKIGTYKCSSTGADCADNDTMLYLSNWYGTLVCKTEDKPDTPTLSDFCKLDGNEDRNVMTITGTGANKLTLSSITYTNGKSFLGSAIHLTGGAIVDITYCVFTDNETTNTNPKVGGGAIYLANAGTTLHIYGTQFDNNKSRSGINHADIYNKGNTATVRVHNTCPFPYNSSVPEQGCELKTLSEVSEPFVPNPTSSDHQAPIYKYSYCGCNDALSCSSMCLGGSAAQGNDLSRGAVAVGMAGFFSALAVALC